LFQWRASEFSLSPQLEKCSKALGEETVLVSNSFEQLNFQELFEKMPIVGYVVDREWRIVAVTDRLLEAIHRSRDAVVGQDVFETFPDNPDNPDADGSAVMRASLERAFLTGETEKLPLQRYDAPPAVPGGAFEERYWLPENVPVAGRDGTIAFVIHTVISASPPSAG
jgi:PAS domain-containing protein